MVNKDVYIIYRLRKFHANQSATIELSGNTYDQSKHITVFAVEGNENVTRNSAIADKPRDAFRGQPRSPNMLPFHMLGMVFY